MGHYKAADFNGAWHDVLVGSTSDHSPERRHILDKQLAAFLLNASGMTLSPGEFQRLKSFLNDGRYNMYSYDSAKANRIGTSDLSAINKLTLRSDVTTDVYMTSNEATHIHNIADVLKMPMLKDAFMDSRKYASFVAAFCGALTNVKDEKSTRKMTGGYVLDFRAFNGVLSKEERHEGLRKVGAYRCKRVAIAAAAAAASNLEVLSRTWVRDLRLRQLILTTSITGWLLTHHTPAPRCMKVSVPLTAVGFPPPAIPRTHRLCLEKIAASGPLTTSRASLGHMPRPLAMSVRAA